MRAADTERQGFVTPAQLEGPSFRLLRSLFPLADRNGDGRLSTGELTTFLDLVASGSSANVALTVTHKKVGLFELFARHDGGRIGVIDLHTASKRLAPLDRNHDGYLSREELPEEVALDFSPGPPAPPDGSPGTAPPPPAGPSWFRSLDRNGDGFLSRREFPGTPEVFDRLDADGDGLVSPAEAERANRPR
jgi:Ca2+-binding EF-hand superfamily protein